MDKIIRYALECHDSTNHKYNGGPYGVHLAMVVGFAYKYINSCIPHQCHDEVIAACWLHDVIEDCRQSYNDVKNIAGTTVADIVFAVSNEKGKTRKDRANAKYYNEIQKTAWATFVKLCDRLANVKYSLDNKSSMYDVYKKENKEFLTLLKPNKHYDDLVEDLCILLNDVMNDETSVATEVK